MVAVSLAAPALRSAPALAGDEAAAEALFIEAKKLAASGKLADACAKFAESNRLDRGAGTLIHLADCYEKNGQSASAWATFKDAASAAQALGRADWQKLATQRAAALESKLAKLTVKVQDPADKIEVTRDGAPTSSASWGTPIPVDVGVHTIQATAPSRTTFRTSINVAKDGDRVEVVVPKLEAAPAASASAPPPAATAPLSAAARADDGAGRRTVGFVVGGVGVASVAVGAVTGLMAVGKNSDSKKACPSDGACASSDAVDANDGARTLALVSTIAFIAGGVGIATGAVLIVTAPSDKGTRAATRERGIRLVPATDGRSANVTLRGEF